MNTILLAKPEKGAQLEGMLVNMARSGQIQQRLTEPELVGLLERVSDTGSRATGKVKVRSRSWVSSGYLSLIAEIDVFSQV